MNGGAEDDIFDWSAGWAVGAHGGVFIDVSSGDVS
jgi:hypothetical protein